MYKTSSKFVDLCLNGDALAEEIDDFVDEWHDSDSTLSLGDFLGFTEKEYRLWVEKPHAINFILAARKNRHSFKDYVEDSDFALAARGGMPEDAKDIIDWLKKSGRL